MSVEAELQRRNGAGATVPWVLVDDAANAETGLSEPVADAGVRDKLDITLSALRDAIVNAVNALEAISAVVSGAVSVTNFPATQLVAGPLTNGELRAAPVPVSGTVTVEGGGGGGDGDSLTDEELRASPVAVSGTVAISNPTANPETGLATEATLADILTELGQKYEGGAIALDAPTLAALETIAVTGPLTDAQLRAATVPVSGTVTANLGTIGSAATQATLASVLAAVDGLEAALGTTADAASASTVVGRLKEIAADLDVSLSTRASQATLDLVLAKLVDIYSAVDGLEITAENIEIAADTINLQTDEVEALLQTIRDRLPALLDADGGLKSHIQNFPAFATEITLAAILTELGQKYEGGAIALDAPTLAALESITVTVANPTANPETGLAKDVVLQAVRDRLPSALDADGGVKVHLQNPDEAGLTDVQLRATPVPVSGTVTANLGTIDGAATEVTLAALLTELGQKYEGGPIALDSATLAALENIVVTGSVTLDATTLAALETITVANMIPAVETGLSKTVDVQAVRDRLPAALDGDGGVKVHLVNTDEAGLTDAQLRASAVPVSGPLTDSQLRAAAVPVSGTVVANLGTIDGVATEATLAYSKNKFAPGIRTTQGFYFNTIGDNIVLTPAAGMRLRVHWVGMSASQDNVGENLVIVKFGPAGAARYRWRMGAPGAFSHWEPIEGTTNEKLYVNLSTTDGIDVNVTWEEVS
jgi:hypothetical protein